MKAKTVLFSSSNLKLLLLLLIVTKLISTIIDPFLIELALVISQNLIIDLINLIVDTVYMLLFVFFIVSVYLSYVKKSSKLQSVIYTIITCHLAFIILNYAGQLILTPLLNQLDKTPNLEYDFINIVEYVKWYINPLDIISDFFKMIRFYYELSPFTLQKFVRLLSTLIYYATRSSPFIIPLVASYMKIEESRSTQNSQERGIFMAKFCSNCGSELLEGADGCVKCGKLVGSVKTGENIAKSGTTKFCSNCGSEVAEGADMCMKCGKLVNTQKAVSSESKSKLVAGLLAFFIGSFGVHNFYLGDNKKGIIHIVLFCGGFLTFGVTSFASAVWALIEAITIFTSKNPVDFEGNPLSN